MKKITYIKCILIKVNFKIDKKWKINISKVRGKTLKSFHKIADEMVKYNTPHNISRDL